MSRGGRVGASGACFNCCGELISETLLSRRRLRGGNGGGVPGTEFDVKFPYFGDAGSCVKHVAMPGEARGFFGGSMGLICGNVGLFGPGLGCPPARGAITAVSWTIVRWWRDVKLFVSRRPPDLLLTLPMLAERECAAPPLLSWFWPDTLAATSRVVCIVDVTQFWSWWKGFWVPPGFRKGLEKTALPGAACVGDELGNRVGLNCAAFRDWPGPGIWTCANTL